MLGWIIVSLRCIENSMPYQKSRTFRLVLVSLPLVVSAAVLVPSAKAQDSEARCQQAISLWMPAEAAPDARVTKWSPGSLGYYIAADHGGDRIVNFFEKSLQFQTQAATLSTSQASGFGPKVIIDLFVAAIPDLSALATARMRGSVTNYFQDFHRRSNTKGVFEIDAAGWDARVREVTPKCLGATLTLQHEIKSAFFAIQTDESKSCVDIGLGETLGLGNIRRYYVAHGRNVPPDLIAAGLQTLYDKRILAGMNRLAATHEVEGICDGR